MQKRYRVYIMTNRPHTVLYTGVTGDMLARGWQHKNKAVRGFTQKYNAGKLVYLEQYRRAKEALAREKQLKGWSRRKKEALINRMNPDWRDLYEDVLR